MCSWKVQISFNLIFLWLKKKRKSAGTLKPSSFLLKLYFYSSAMSKFCIHWDCTLGLSGYIHHSPICKHGLQHILMQIRYETGHLSWLEFSFFIDLENFISFRDGCRDDGERISEIAFILLSGFLLALWAFINENRPFHWYSKCPGPAPRLGGNSVRNNCPLQKPLYYFMNKGWIFSVLQYPDGFRWM